MPLSETLLVYMAMLAVGILAAALFRRLPIPYTALLVMIGAGLETLARISGDQELLDHFRLTPELVLFVFLPTLIFESGFNLNARQLVKDIAPVLVLAVPALLASTAAIGVGLWLILQVPLVTALLFGALISATDPVAVIALFKELGVPQRLTVLVEGESLLNDATAIVVFNILLGLALYGEMQWSDAGLAIGRFFEVFIGGALVGILFGSAASWLMAQVVRGTPMVLILSLVTAYTSFIIAEHQLHLSGVMAVAAAAVTLRVVGIPRLPIETGNALGETWEFLAMICNTLLFLLVGLSVDLIGLLSRIDSILLAVLVVLAARASMIYTLVPSATRVFGLPRVTRGELHIMWWGGLKGGLAIAIVLSIPPDLPGRQLLLDLTLGVVIITLLINAPTVRPLIRRLGIDRPSDVERAEMERSSTLARARAQDLLERFGKAGILSRPGLQQAARTLDEALSNPAEPSAGEQRLCRERLDALRVELSTLEELYQAHVIPQYTFLDLKGELLRLREDIVAGEPIGAGVARPNPFLRIENALIHSLREKDWAAAMLARYQSLRMSQHLLKDVARILMAGAAQDYLRREHHRIAPALREPIESYYAARMQALRTALAQLRLDFPESYRRFESHLSLRAALAQAGREVDEEVRHGSLGAKPATLMQRRIQAAMEGIPAIGVEIPAMQPRDLVALVPLFEGLPTDAQNEVAGRTRPVHFLCGDTIIGEGERGDALYIVARGRVVVTQRDPHGEEHLINDLGVGDFFGELGLLGDHVRTATVRAAQSSTLLRLTRRDMLAIAELHAAVDERLREAEMSRREADAADA